MSDDKAMIEGTDEYKAAYEKAYDALENPKAVEEVKEIVEPVEQQIEVKAEVKAPEVTPTESPLETKVKELEERLSTTGKALKDTQTWGHRLAAELKVSRKGLRDANPPELLKDLPGLEEAIRHVAVRDDEDEPVKPENEWVSAVNTALPDMDSLLADEAFTAKAKELRTKHANDWGNPLFAIQHLSTLRQEHITQKAVDAAVKAHSAKIESTQRKMTEMDVPGDNGKAASRSAPDLRNDAEYVRNMPIEQFLKMKSKTLGY